MYTFFWRLYKITDDPAYVQVMYQANNDSTKRLPHDLFTDDLAAFQRNVRRVIDEFGAKIQLGSINKTAWHLSVLRSSSPLGGKGMPRRFGCTTLLVGDTAIGTG